MKTAILAFLLPATLLGCDPENVTPKVPIAGTEVADPPGTTAGADAAVVDRIAQAACDREQSCGTIGPGGYFKEREDCLTTMRAKFSKQINHQQCPAGIERGAFDDCISAFRANECAQPGDEITRSAHCSVSDLCLKATP
jgi:hypothetical protein